MLTYGFALLTRCRKFATPSISCEQMFVLLLTSRVNFGRISMEAEYGRKGKYHAFS